MMSPLKQTSRTASGRRSSHRRSEEKSPLVSAKTVKMEPRPRSQREEREAQRRAEQRLARLRAKEFSELSAEIEQVRQWLVERNIEEVELVVPDFSGIARGKILPAEKFIKGWANHGLRLPESIFIQTVTGDFPEEDVISPTDIDIYLYPDPDSISLVPWYEDEPTAQVICDCYYSDGRPVTVAPRYVLRQILSLYHERGWEPVIGPELEFFLVAANTDPDYPLEPPIGRSGRPETGRQAFGIDAVNEFDPIFECIYNFCDDQGIDIDTLSHEGGAAQMEMNFNHGPPLRLADQAFQFKRTVREAALRHNVYATFMAKPMQDEPGSAMHIHQSVIDRETRQNLFADAHGQDTSLFLSHIAGLQRYLGGAMPMLAPNVNSYRRLVPHLSAPINLHWARDNRTAGLRVPFSDKDSRRVENRVAGADCNPYLAIAASLACGYLGMIEALQPSDALVGSAYEEAERLPRHLPEALDRFKQMARLQQLLGKQFSETLNAVKQTEWEAYSRVISSWERENLLLNV